MSKRSVIRRAAEKLGLTKRTLASYTVAEVEKMSEDQQQKFVLGQLPQLSAIFAAVGDPKVWPAFTLYTVQQKRGMEKLYDDWRSGLFNGVEGVTTPPPPPGTTLH